MRPQQFAAFALIGLIWGSEWIAKQAIDSPPLRALAIRHGIGALLLAFVSGVRRIERPAAGSMIASALTGFTMLALPAMLIAWAADRISPGLLVVILSLTPLLAALLEECAGGLLAPLMGGVGGTTLMASQGLSFAAVEWTGAAAMLAAAALIAGSIVYVKRRLSGVSPLTLSGIQLAAGCATLLLGSLAREGWSGWGWTRESLSWELILAVFGNCLAFPLYYHLLQRLDSFQLASTQWLVTLAGVVEALILLGGRPSWRLPGGMILTLVSLWSLLRRGAKDEKPLTIQITFPPSSD